MKQKLAAILAVIMMCMSLTACGGGKDIETTESDIGNKYFDLVYIYEDKIMGTRVGYDRNTGVMYFTYTTYYKFGITPIYNADGSLKLYEEEITVDTEVSR